MEEDLEFWGYLHTSGDIKLKRYFDTRDIQDAKESPFVKRICPPFFAKNWEAAREIIFTNLTQ